MEITRIDIRPLSVNAGYKGRRFKTTEHKQWARSVMFLLPKIILPPPPYEIYFKFGFSSNSSDYDNAIKHTQDCIATRYRFNDKLIRRAVIDIDIVPKGKEYIEFSLKTKT